MTDQNRTTGYEGRSLTNLEMLERRLRTEGRVYTHMEAAAVVERLRRALQAISAEVAESPSGRADPQLAAIQAIVRLALSGTEP